MLRKIKKEKNEDMAKIFWNGKPIGAIRHEWLEDLEDGIDAIPNELHRVEAFFTWNCIKSGKKVKVQREKKKIELYERKQDFDQNPDYVITENPELYSLLENLARACENQKRIHS